MTALSGVVLTLGSVVTTRQRGCQWDAATLVRPAAHDCIEREPRHAEPAPSTVVRGGLGPTGAKYVGRTDYSQRS